MGSRKVARMYGDILLKSWKDLFKGKLSGVHENSGVIEAFEDNLQNLVYDCIHAENEKYFTGCREVLGVLHDAKFLKNSQGIEDLLYRIYAPILFRSLRCVNSVVRAQASILFFDVFPLVQESSTTTGVTNIANFDAILQKQFDLLSALLKDVDHRVRAASASGVCHILKEYYEVLPVVTTKQILSYVVGTLGFDISTPTVRLAVIVGLKELLEQPLSHNVLKGLLPLLKNTLNDKSYAVRIAFLQLLIMVKS